MEKYEVIIIGSGIAGSGLAYNLKKIGFNGEVLVIDKNSRENKLSYRISFKDPVEKYNLPYEFKYKSLKWHFSKRGMIELNVESFLMNYNKICSYLLEESNFEFRNEEAIDVKNNYLKTDKNVYRFKYLIDCSGNAFFGRKLRKMKIPFKYWLGYSRVVDSTVDLERNSLHYFFHEDGFFEDIYPLKNRVMYGYWRYCDKKNLKRVELPKETSAQKIVGDGRIVTEFSNNVPCSPTLPLVFKNIAFLGDSFGNATTSSAEGIKPILDSSEILAYALEKQNLKIYEKVWKREYLDSYIKFLAFRMVRYPNSDFFKRIKKKIMPDNVKIFENFKENPEILFKILRNESSFKPPKDFRNNSGKVGLILMASIYLNLKLKYAFM